MNDANWMKMFSSHPWLWALGLLLLFYLAYRRFSGTWNIFALALGADGRLSTSKLQFMLWTTAVLYVFIALVFAHGNASFSDQLPQNILLVMGFSLTTAVGAKYIVVNQPTTPPAADSGPPTMDPKYLIADNDGRPDLNKAQMLAWTIVGIVAFLMDAGGNWNNYASCTPSAGSPCFFPDVPQALMLLMGLGQGAYLGGKIVPQNTAGQSS